MCEKKKAVKEAVESKAAVCNKCPAQWGISAILGRCLKPSVHHVRVRVNCHACDSDLVKPVQGVSYFVDCPRYQRWLDRHDRDLKGHFCPLPLAV